MFIRRFVQRNTFHNFIRRFSESGTSLNESQPRPQTITPESTSSSTEGDKKLPNEAQLKTISEYKEALNFFQQGKYRISNEFFQRVLTQLEATGQKGSDNHIHVLKKFLTLSLSC